MKLRTSQTTLLLLSLSLVCVVAVRMLVGESLWKLDRSTAEYFLSLRAARVVIGGLVGVCLGVGGVLVQALLRNPLASPDILGMSGGASLAVTATTYVVSLIGHGSTESAGATMGVAGWHTVPALLGALGVLALVYSLSQRRGLVDPTSLVLIGVVISVMCGAGVLFVQYLMPGMTMTGGAMRLLVGTISDETRAREVWLLGGVAALGLIVGVRCGPAMDVATLGDDEATSMGVNVRTLRFTLLGVAGLLTAAAVMVAGPIGFVGLVCPHVTRMMAGPGVGGGGHRALVIGSALAGAALVIGADAVVKTLDFGGGRMPIGIVTATVGGAVFIGLLRAELRR